MKAVILAGGYGTRLSEETGVRPKPMVDVGGYPILWHIMKIYSTYGVQDFVICCGYKGEIIKRYFSEYSLHAADLTVDMREDRLEFHHRRAEPWRVTLVDTGDGTMTGGRLRRIQEHLDDEAFHLTYGDGVSNVDIGALVGFHRSQGTLATVTAVRPPGRFGVFNLRQSETRVGEFREKPDGDGAWINGGFFVLEPRVLEFIDGDQTVWEREPMERLATEGELSAFRHGGFWQPMDTLRDKEVLEEHWKSGKAPWKVWDR